MTSDTRSAVPRFVVAGLALAIAVVTGVQWLGEPLRLVHLLTLVGVAMTAGVAWAQALARVRQGRGRDEAP